MLECAGVHDVLSKSLGWTTLNIVRATVTRLRELERPEQVAARRGLPWKTSHRCAAARQATDGS